MTAGTGALADSKHTTDNKTPDQEPATDKAADAAGKSPDPSSSSAAVALGALCAIARLHHVAADPATLAHQLGLASSAQLEISDLLHAAKHLGLKAKRSSTTAERLQLTPLPALAIMRTEDESLRVVILAQCDGQRVLLQDPAAGGGHARPTIEPLEVFASQWTGDLVLITSRASLAGELAKFDFSWFIPSLVKHRKLLGEVLLISFMLQLFALVSPLFFQVVMDKVLVHKGLTTLDVLVIGLLCIVVFESVLSALRSYVFSHTTSRIDVELGSRLFRHLMALPLAYFQARRVGDSVARVRELENIRSFLTGNALTVVLDVFFSVVFIAVMLFYSVPLTLIVLVSLPLYFALSLLVVPVLRKRLDVKFARGAENQAMLVETVTGIQTVKATALEPAFARRWDKQLAAYVSASFKTQNLASVANEGVNLIGKSRRRKVREFYCCVLVIMCEKLFVKRKNKEFLMISIDKALRLLSRSAAAAALGLSVASHAEEPRRLDEVDNIGFMRSPSTELRSRFPMCDAFLTVEWIDAKKRIGVTHYDTYSSDARKIRPKATALIDLSDGSYFRLDYSTSKYLLKSAGKNQEIRRASQEQKNLLFDFIRHGRIDRASSALRIVWGDKEIELISISVEREELGVERPYDISLSGHRMNVCVPFPSNQKVWIAEKRHIRMNYSESDIENLMANLREKLKQEYSPERGAVLYGYALDINLDGKNDYVFDRIVYSYGDSYFAMEPIWESGSDPKYGWWRFPPSERICDQKSEGALELTTDGKSYFLNDACNLTEILTQQRGNK